MDSIHHFAKEYCCVQAIPTEQRALIIVNNGKESTVNRALGGSTYPG